MGGRFEHLEFGENRDRQRQEIPQQIGTPIASAGAYLLQADEEYRLGRFEKALRLYTRCLEEDRGRIAAWVGQVQMLVQLDECHEARLWAGKALELFRNNGELLAAKAQACIRMKDKQAAFACSDASMKSPGSSAYRWQARGEVLLASNEKTYDPCFKKSLTEPNADWFDRAVIANIYLFYRKAAAALEFASQAVQLSPASPYAWYIMANCYKDLGMSGTAVSGYEKCLQLRADFQEASAALAEAGSMSLFRRLVRRLRGGR